MSTAVRERLNLLLTDLAEELDVPPSRYEEAEGRYEAVGDWLGRDDSALSPFRPLIYPQGSFALGTAVRPLSEDDYDVDSVCLLQEYPPTLTQSRLKSLVGDRLKHPTSRYRKMIQPPQGGRRCWSIKYADDTRFHLDVLPAIPDEYDWLLTLGVPGFLAESAIRITDRESWHDETDWPRSNPKGYAEWFKEQMRVRLEAGRRLLALERNADIETIADYEVRTPLQRLVQLLKRHRNIRYAGDDDKPTSIILTTLAASSYDNEENPVETLLAVVPRMRAAIRRVNGVWWVPNPVNPRENFADRWADQPRRVALFFEWLEAVEREHEELLSAHAEANTAAYLESAYGPRDAKAALARFASKRRAGAAGATAPFVITPRKGGDPVRPPTTLPHSPSKPWRP